jgi:type VI secretion system protein ImpF
MAELNRDQRFLPCLLDRLRDDDPGNREESRTHRVISLQRYKEGVVRDLRWLLNASARIPVQGTNELGLGDYPEAHRSVLNFGTRQLSGLVAPDLEEFERQLGDAIQLFEPRFLRHSLKIKAKAERHIISFELHAELWAEPVSEQLFLRTTLDIETGQSAVGENANG